MLPPQHRVDRPMVFVLTDDEAWKGEELEESLGKIVNAHEQWEAKHDDDTPEPMDVTGHPWTLYRSGATRWDIHAELPFGEGTATPADWIDLGRATQFRLRRLRRGEWQEVHAMVQLADAQGIRRPLEAWAKALEYAFVSMEGPDAIELKLSRAIRGRRYIAKESLDALFDLLGADQFADLAQAAWLGSLPLTPSEKKGLQKNLWVARTGFTPATAVH